MPVLFPRRRRRFPIRVAGGESKARTKAIITVAERMDELSKITGSMEQLNNTMTSLLNAVGELPKGEQDYIKAEHRKDIEEEEIWETVRDTAKDQEKETVDSWKDELNNLLVFAGLFSAVVTAFTVESYTWLQQDPGDATNALLAQMSQQLARLSFMITFVGNPSSALVNSTSPTPAAEPPFSPVSYAVSVNTLWVLSLTLSLISAFFAIAAQQWLRQLHLPPEMPVRRAVQLLEARKDGLKTWQVPSIIALLPLLLQIAVIFFLVGLFLLLRSLNTTVATAFGSVAVVGILAFLAITVIPLITPRCPYKTPLVPTILIVLQCLSYPLAVLSLPFAIFLFFSMIPPILFLFLINADTRADWMSERFEAIGDFITDKLPQYLQSFGRHMFVDMGEFWLTREYQYICPCDEADPPNLDLERSSLIQTLLSTPARRSSKVSQLLNSSTDDRSVQSVQDTVVSSLRAFRTGLSWADLIPGLNLDPKMMLYIRKWLSARHHRLLWQYLQQRDWKRDGFVMPADSECLIVFHELDNAFPATRPQHAKHLLQICAQQGLSENCRASETVPACLVLDLIMNRGYVPDEGDVDALLASASKVYDKYRDDLGHDYKRQLFLVSTALALIADNKSGAARSAGVTSTVNILAGALDKESMKERAVDELQRYYETGSSWAHYHPEYMSPARIMQALCEAVLAYAANPLLLPSTAHLQDLTHISASLRHICTCSYGRHVRTFLYGEMDYGDYAEQPGMQAACRVLDELNVKIGELDDLVYRRNERNTVVTLEAILSAKARLVKPALPGNGGNEARLDANEALTEYTDTATDTAETYHLVSAAGEPAETDVGHDHHPLIAALADHGESLAPPSAEHSTGPDSAASGNKSTISSALDKSEGEARASSPQDVEETCAGDEPGRSRQEPLRSNAASTDGALSQPPSVENSTDRHLTAFGSDSTASSALDTEALETPAISSHLPTSKPQDTQAIQVIAASRAGSAVGQAALNGPRDTEETSSVSDADSVAIGDNHFHDEGDRDVETRGSGGGGVERNGTTSGEFYVYHQDARSTAALATTAASSARADESNTAQVSTLEDDNADIRSDGPTSSNKGSAEGVDGSSSTNMAAAIPSSPEETEATQLVSTGETNVAAGESLVHDEDDSATTTNAR